MEKLFRAVVSVFFLCCLLSPFALAIDLPTLDLEAAPYPAAEIEARAQRLEDVLSAQTDDAVRWEAAKLVGEKLAERGINYHDVAISIEQNGQSAGAALSADVILDRRHEPDHRAIQSQLEEALGFPVRLLYGSPPKAGSHAEN
jgi:hypothetical protein